MAVVLTSASPNASEEAINSVFEKHGLEREAPPEPPPAAAATVVEVPAEPIREDFDSDDEFKSAHGEWEKADNDARAKREAEEEEAEKKVSRFQRKVDKKVAQRTAALERQVEELRQKLEEKESAQPEAKDKKTPEENPRPKREDFKSDEEHADAVIEWRVQKAIAEKEQAAAAKAAKEATDAENARLEANYQDYRAQVEEFKEEHDDWDEVVNREDIPMHVAVQLALLEQPNGAEVTYYLGKHPEFALKLAELSPLQAVVEIGLLSRKLAEPATNRASGPTTAWGGGPKTSTRPRVPAPVQPVRTGATLASMTSKDAAQARDYKSFKKAQRAGR